MWTAMPTIGLFFLLPAIISCQHMNELQSSTTQEPDTCRGVTFENIISKLGERRESDEVIFPSRLDQSCYCVGTDASKQFLYTAVKIVCPIRCIFCDAQHPRCDVQGTCCQTSVSSNRTTSVATTSSITSNVCIELERAKYYLLMRSCPEDYADDNTRMLCEEELPFHNVSIATIQVVTDESTGVTYFNKYCAQCNNVTQVRPWKPEIHCFSNLDMVSALTREEYVRLGFFKNERCFIRQKPDGIDAVKCHSQLYVQEDHVINSCNVEGSEVVFDLDVEDKCQKTPNSFDERVMHGTKVYKNIHCLMCNSEIAMSQTKRDCLQIITGDRAPFQFLFGLEEDGFDEKSEEVFIGNADGFECQSDQWLDPQGNCRRLECTAGKILQGNHCETALVDQIKGLPYRTGLLLIPESHSLLNSSDAVRQVSIEQVTMSIADAVKDMLSSFAKDLDIFLGVLFGQEVVKSPLHANSNNITSDQSSQNTTMVPTFVWMKIYLVAPQDQYRDAVEVGIINTLNISSIVIAIGDSYTTSYKVQVIQESSFEFKSSCERFPNTSTCDTSHHMYKSNYGRPLSRSVRQLSVKQSPTSTFIEMLPYLACPYVELSQEEVQETIEVLPVPHVTKVVLQFGGSTFELTEKAMMDRVRRGRDGMYYVCLNVLQTRILPDQVDSELADLSNRIQYVLTILCVSASLLCLSATVLTYCLFPGLRNVAGCNTMGLSVSLMAAQILLFVANTIRGPSTLCTCIGVSVHYSWLVMFSWTFLCCLHILKVFTGIRAQPRNSPYHDRKVIATNLITTLSVPALIVAIIIGVSLALSNGERYGYGYTKCAMDNPFAIHGPLIFVITCNIAFFVIVVCKIWSVSRLKGKMDMGKQDRNDFVIYMKLSTLTGMFWLLAVLGEVFYNDILRGFAVVFNGSQGAFIFFSFIASRRVLKLYLEKFKLG